MSVCDSACAAARLPEGLPCPRSGFVRIPAVKGHLYPRRLRGLQRFAHRLLLAGGGLNARVPRVPVGNCEGHADERREQGAPGHHRRDVAFPGEAVEEPGARRGPDRRGDALARLHDPRRRPAALHRHVAQRKRLIGRGHPADAETDDRRADRKPPHARPAAHERRGSRDRHKAHHVEEDADDHDPAAPPPHEPPRQRRRNHLGSRRRKGQHARNQGGFAHPALHKVREDHAHRRRTREKRRNSGCAQGERADPQKTRIHHRLPAARMQPVFPQPPQAHQGEAGRQKPPRPRHRRRRHERQHDPHDGDGEQSRADGIEPPPQAAAARDVDRLAGNPLERQQEHGRGHRHVESEGRPPADRLRQQFEEHSAHGGSDRHGDAHRRPEDSKSLRPLLAAIMLLDQAPRLRRVNPRAEAHDGARDVKHEGVHSQGRRRRRERENQHPRSEKAAAPQNVARAPRRDQDDADGQRVPRKSPLHLAWRGIQGHFDGRQGDVDDAHRDEREKQSADEDEKKARAGTPM